MSLIVHYPELIDSSRRQRRAELVQDQLSLDQFWWLIQHWLLARPTMSGHNADIEAMGGHIIGEIKETMEELDQPLAELDYLAVFVELFDVKYLILALAASHGFQLDEFKIKSKMNGYGGRSDVFEHMIEVAGNLNPKQLEQDLTHLMSVALSQLAQTPGLIYPQLVLQKLFSKNNHNYPAELFISVDPLTGKKLDSDEMEQAYLHVRQCLRFIRDYHVEVLGNSDRIYGLRKDDWQDYREFILDFWQSRSSFKMLVDLLRGKHRAEELLPFEIQNGRMKVIELEVTSH